MMKNALIYGVGKNDSDGPVSRYGIVNGKRTKVWRCPFYVKWHSMLERCYSKKMHKKHPTYIGCTSVKEWHLFSVFRDWMAEYDWMGKHLDKDLLSNGPKIYGPEFCVFVSHDLNSFLNDVHLSPGGYATGVSVHKQTGKFQSYCNNPFTLTQEHLGLFNLESDAHEAWRAKKHEHACRYADMQEDQRIASALRIRYAPIGEVNDE